MTTLDDIKRMQKEGKSEEEIVETLQSQGIPKNEIYDSLTQTKIKQAVSGSEEAPELPVGAQFEGMSPSLTTEAEAPVPEELPAPSPEQAPQEQQYYAQTGAAEAPQEQYYQQQSYAPTSETISEISEQIVTEKLSSIRSKLEKAIDNKTKLEAQIGFIDERLKRIETIIDKLQLSILQKVGSYVNNVEDIKREMVETQKSFKSLLEKHEKKKA